MSADVYDQYVNALEDQCRLRNELKAIHGALRNYELNGSDAVKQILGVYQDGDETSTLMRKYKARAETSEAHLALLGLRDLKLQYMVGTSTSLERNVENAALQARMCGWARALDQYMTGKQENRRTDRDTEAAKDCLSGTTWLIYLSDGGYSRLSVNFLDRGVDDKQVWPIWLTSESLPKVKARWEKLLALTGDPS